MAGSACSRILITADTLGGVWQYALELARLLTARGVHVILATMGGPLAPHQRSQVEAIPSLTMHEAGWKLEWMQQPWDDVSYAGEWLLALERRYQPDIVHLNQFAFGALQFAAPTLLVAHSCVLSWWRAVHGHAAPASWDRYRQMVLRGLQGAGAVAAPTQAMLDALRSEYDWHGGACVLGNGRDPATYRPAAKQAFILAAGRIWDAGKNLAALQAVAGQLPWPVCVAGPTVHPDGGEVIPGDVQWLGQLADDALASQLACASIYALPARYEPFGLSALEAGLCGCALVLGDIASLREVWGDAATYVPPDDPNGLRDALLGLIERTDERQRLAAAARARAQQFTPARMGDAYLAAYRGLEPAFAMRGGKELLCA
jgi:glycogen synthase